MQVAQPACVAPRWVRLAIWGSTLAVGVFSPFAVGDVKPALIRESRASHAAGELLVGADDTHWGGKGLRVAAEEIARVLVS